MSNYSSTLTTTQLEPASSESIEAVYPGFDCIMIESSGEMYAVIGVYCFVCLIPTVIGLHAIIGHYCSSKVDIMFEIRLWSIAGTTSFLIFDYDAIIDVYFAMKCDFSPNSYMAKYDDYGSMFSGIGFYCLYFLFVLKLKHAFKDSLFDVSRRYIISLTIFGIIGFTCSMTSYIMFILTFEAAGFVLVSMEMAFYICGNILLTTTLFSTLYSFIKYKNEDNATLNKNDQMFQAFVRLIVVYTCAIGSTVMVIVIWVLTGFIFSENVILFNQWAMWFRALLIMDNIINICCLLFQNKSALKFYEKSCCLCHRFVMKIAQRRINHHIKTTHTTTSGTVTPAEVEI